jgi:hypothetical protein
MLYLEYWPPEDDWSCVTFSTLLNHKMPWYRRIPRAIMYLLGKSTNYSWDEVLLTPSEAQRMITFLMGFLEADSELGDRLEQQKLQEEYLDENANTWEGAR